MGRADDLPAAHQRCQNRGGQGQYLRRRTRVHFNRRRRAVVKRDEGPGRHGDGLAPPVRPGEVPGTATHQVREHPVAPVAVARGPAGERPAVVADIQEHHVVRLDGPDLDPEVAGLADAVSRQRPRLAYPRVPLPSESGEAVSGGTWGDVRQECHPLPSRHRSGLIVAIPPTWHAGTSKAALRYTRFPYPSRKVTAISATNTIRTQEGCT